MAQLIDFTGGQGRQPLGGELERSLLLKRILDQQRRNRPQIRSVGEGFANLGADAINAFTLANLRRQAEATEAGDREAIKEFFQGNTGLNAEKAIQPTEEKLSDRLLSEPTPGVEPATPIDVSALPTKRSIDDTNRFATDFQAISDARMAGRKQQGDLSLSERLTGGSTGTPNIRIDLQKQAGPFPIPRTDQSLVAPLGQPPAPPARNLGPLFDRPGTAPFAQQFALQNLATEQANQQAQSTRFNKLADVRQAQGFRRDEREAGQVFRAGESAKSRNKVLTPGQFNQQVDLKRAGRTRVNQTVNQGNLSPDQKKELESVGTGRGDRFNEGIIKANDARDQNFELEGLRKVDIDTGPGTDVKAKLLELGQAFGFTDEKIAKFTGNAQKFRALVAGEVNKELNKAKGPQTEGDAKRAKDKLQSLGNSPEANRFIIGLTIAKNNRLIIKSQFEEDYFDDNDTLKGVAKAWRESPENAKSLFNDPVLAEFKGDNSPQLNPEAESFLKKMGVN